MNFHQIKTIEEVLSNTAVYKESILCWFFFDKLFVPWFSKIEKRSGHLVKNCVFKNCQKKKRYQTDSSRADLSEGERHAGKGFSILLCFYFKTMTKDWTWGNHPFILVITIYLIHFSLSIAVL